MQPITITESKLLFALTLHTVYKRNEFIPWCQGTVVASSCGVFVRRFQTGWPPMSPPISCSTALHSLSPLHKSRIDCKSLKKYLSTRLSNERDHDDIWNYIWPILLLTRAQQHYQQEDILAFSHTFKYFRSWTQCQVKIISFDKFQFQKFARS